MISTLIFAGAAALAAASSPQFVLEEHPTLRFSKDTFVLFRMRWAGEYRGPESSLPAGRTEWGFVRRRFSVEGAIGGLVAFEVETDLEGDERWKDVHVTYTPHDALNVRAGKFVIPFGYERTTSLELIDVAYRSMASNHLAPARDRGVMLFGALLNRTLTYDAGLFEDGRALAGRLVARQRGIEIGAAVMTGDLVEAIGTLRGQTALGHTFFSGTLPAGGRRHRTTVFGAYRAGRASVKTEYITVRERPEGEAAETDAAGWYLGGSVVLTGDREADAHHPRRPLFRGGIGSIELAARTEALEFTQGTEFRARARAHTLGINWQPVRWVRVQANAVRDLVPIRAIRMWTHVFRIHILI